MGRRWSGYVEGPVVRGHRKIQPASVPQLHNGWTCVKMSGLEAFAFDADAQELEVSDAVDSNLMELLMEAEECTTLTAMVSTFFCQGLLLGLSFIAALMAIRFDSEHLFDCLQLLEPWFSAMMLVCSEIALVGSLLQVCQA